MSKKENQAPCLLSIEFLLADGASKLWDVRQVSASDGVRLLVGRHPPQVKWEDEVVRRAPAGVARWSPLAPIVLQDKLLGLIDALHIECVRGCMTMSISVMKFTRWCHCCIQSAIEEGKLSCCHFVNCSILLPS